MAIGLVPLCTLSVVRGPRVACGPTPFGSRVVAEVAEATAVGERLSGRLAGAAAADWATTGEDGVTIVDARIALETDDGASVLITYGGRIADLRIFPEVAVYVAPVFHTGDPRYRWLCGIQAIGKGSFTADGTTLVYDIYEVR